MSSTPLSPSAAADSQADRLSFPDAPLTDAEKTPRKRTTGEKYFDGITYAGIAGAVTFVLSVATMYLTKHSESKAFFGLSEKTWSKSWQDLGTALSEASIWKSIADSRLGKTKLFSFVHDKKNLQNFSESMLTTLALNMGGMAMMLPVNYAEHHKKDFVHGLNEKFGKPGEVEIGDMHVKNEPPQTLGSILTGRATAVVTVLFSLTVLNSWITKAAKVFVKPNSGPALTAASENALGAVEKWSENLFSKAHKFVAPNAPEKRNEFWKKIGKISAIDAIATVAASSILYVSSKFYSRIGTRRDSIKTAADKGGIGTLQPETVAAYGTEPAPETTAPPTTTPMIAAPPASAPPQADAVAETPPIRPRIAPRGSYVAEATKPAEEAVEHAR